jgi:hypothetical protein
LKFYWSRTRTVHFIPAAARFPAPPSPGFALRANELAARFGIARLMCEKADAAQALHAARIHEDCLRFAINFCTASAGGTTMTSSKSATARRKIS